MCDMDLLLVFTVWIYFLNDTFWTYFQFRPLSGSTSTTFFRGTMCDPDKLLVSANRTNFFLNRMMYEILPRVPISFKIVRCGMWSCGPTSSFHQVDILLFNWGNVRLRSMLRYCVSDRSAEWSIWSAWCRVWKKPHVLIFCTKDGEFNLLYIRGEE